MMHEEHFLDTIEHDGSDADVLDAHGTFIGEVFFDGKNMSRLQIRIGHVNVVYRIEKVETLEDYAQF